MRHKRKTDGKMMFEELKKLYDLEGFIAMEMDGVFWEAMDAEKRLEAMAKYVVKTIPDSGNQPDDLGFVLDQLSEYGKAKKKKDYTQRYDIIEIYNSLRNTFYPQQDGSLKVTVHPK